MRLAVGRAWLGLGLGLGSGLVLAATTDLGQRWRTAQDYISPVSPLYLHISPHISPSSPLHPPYISRAGRVPRGGEEEGGGPLPRHHHPRGVRPAHLPREGHPVLALTLALARALSPNPNPNPTPNPGPGPDPNPNPNSIPNHLSGGLADRVGRARLAVCGSLATAFGVACTSNPNTNPNPNPNAHMLNAVWSRGQP